MACLQYSCLKNSMDRGAWWATVHGVKKSQTWLSTAWHLYMQKHTHIYICQRDQEQREGLHRRAVRKHLNELDNHYGAVSYPELDILEFEVKWALGSTAVNKASGCDGIPVELFKTLKDDAIKVLHSICQQIWKTQQWPQDWKMSILIPIPKKGSAKECSSHQTIAFIYHVSKVILKILHARLQHYVNQEPPDVQAGLF